MGYIEHVIYNLFSSFSFSAVGGQSQGLRHANQVMYPLNYVLVPSKNDSTIQFKVRNMAHIVFLPHRAGLDHSDWILIWLS